jgi:predicted alpha/beta-fold hydrolase
MPVSKSRLFYALLSTHTLMVMGTTILIIYTLSVAPLDEPLLYLSVLVLFLAYYFYGGVLDMRVYRNDSVVHQRMISGMSCLQTRYKPTWYLLNANLQTLFAAAGRPSPDVTFERELVEGVYPDGEICRLDWCNPIPATKVPPTTTTTTTTRTNNGSTSNNTNTSSATASTASSKAPVVILFHGLTGGSDDSNMHYLTQAIHRIGWHVVIPVRRGCGDEATITVPKFYAYGGIEDTAHVVDYIATKMRGHVILGVGISAGSNILANYLGTLGSRSRIQAAISVANGFCWDKGTRAIESTTLFGTLSCRASCTTHCLAVTAVSSTTTNDMSSTRPM